jgi:hypothetical protein
MWLIIILDSDIWVAIIEEMKANQEEMKAKMDFHWEEVKTHQEEIKAEIKIN